MKALPIFYWIFAISSLFLLAPLAFAEGISNPVLVIKDGRFLPETLEIPSGQKVRLEIRNEGKAAEEFESSDLNREKLIPAGGKASITLGPLQPGQYRFFGEFNPKTAQGVIVVR